MEIAVLGPMEIVGDHGERLHLSSRSQLQVLAGLVAHRGTSLTPEQLAEIAGLSIAGLRTAISRLRALAGREIVETTPSGYRLGSTNVDADRFDELLERARSSESAARLEILEQAAALWRGEPYGGLLADHESIRPDAVRLAALRTSAEEDRIETLIEVGRFAEAGNAAEMQVLVHPLRDRPRGLLMRALAASGRQAEALRAFQEHRRQLADEIGTEPGDAVADLDARIATGWHDLPPPPSQPLDGNLPAWANAFVGRERDQERLLAAIRTRRLVTLVGVGGVGKTRLAVEAIVAGHYEPDGCWIVELGSLTDGAQVPAALAGTLGVRQAPGLSVTESLVQWANGRRLLVILDNCEHVLRSTAALVDALLERSDGVRVVATSREPLMAQGEHVVPVPPLSLPDGPGSTGSAVELFVSRAEHEATAFDAEAQLDAIAELCERLDGIPLAIELAAARVRALSVPDILLRLDERFRLLTGGRRTAVERHATLRATVEWSYLLLSEAERATFRDLSIFEGPFTLDDAVLLMSDRFDELEGVDLVSRLVDRSLIVRGSARPEYRMLETLRAYGREVHGEAGTIDSARARHHEVLAEKAAATRRAWCGPDEPAAIPLAMAQLDDYRAAALWAVSAGRPDDAVSLIRDVMIPLMLWGETDLIGSTMTELLDVRFTTDAAAAACCWMASNWNMFLGGDLDRAVALADEAVRLDPSDPMAHIHVALGAMITGRNPGKVVAAVDIAAESDGDPSIELWPHIIRGHALLQDGQVAAARQAASDFEAWSVEREFAGGLAMALHLKGRVLAEADDVAAVDALTAAQELVEERIPAAWIVAANLDRELSPLLHRLGRPDAVDVAARCLESSLRHHETGNVVSAFAYVAGMLSAADRDRVAAVAVGAAGTTRLAPADARSFDAAKALLRERLGDATYERLVADGAEMATVDLLRVLVAELRSVLAERAASAS